MSEPTEEEIEQWVEAGLTEQDPPDLDNHWLPYWYRPEER